MGATLTNSRPRWVWLDGRLVPEAEATVPLAARGLLFGEGVFETIAVRNGRPFGLAAHLARMREAARALALFDVPVAALEAAVPDVIARNGLRDGLVKLVCAAGPEGEGAGARPIAAVMVPAPRPIPPEWRERGVSVSLAAIRTNETSPAGRAKTLSYLERRLARREADRAGAGEALLLTAHGHVAEGAGSNVFWSKGGRVYTPALEAGILPGTTRALVLPLVAGGVAQGLYPLEALQGADEAFLTSARLGVMPVKEVAGRYLKLPAPGPITRRLAGAYEALVARETGAAGSGSGTGTGTGTTAVGPPP